MPLKPFSLPEGISLPFSPSPETLLAWFFNFILLYWLAYSLVAAYHWVTYSHNANIATPALVLHIFVSLTLIGYAASGLLMS